MQFHLNGFKGSGDPRKLEFEGSAEPDFQTSLPDEADVLIVGGGPAGLLLATQLSRFPNITTRIIDTKPGPLQQGQADGLQCRTVEIFEAFGFAEKALKEAYWVNETTFWSPTEDGQGIKRTGRIRDTEEGLSEMPHIILNQARLHEMWEEAMKWSPTRLETTYGRSMKDLSFASDGSGMVQVEVQKSSCEMQERVRAKYVVGCDGARSGVRQALGLEMKGDFANQAWGVLDALVVTDFPDVRLKSTIHSSQGSIIIIPREGGYLVRFYISLEKSESNERLNSTNVTVEMVIERAKQIFRPYNIDVKHVAYWSVYEVGQRLTDRFDDVAPEQRDHRTPRVFITGDACHTHSAKAGQGMNVSMNDSYNLGWKLASVLHGTADPSILHTYTEERQDIAQQLIDFDREISRLSAAKPQSTSNGTEERHSGSAIDPAVFQEYFTRQGRFMAGLETRYKPGLLTMQNKSFQHLAQGFQIGTRFHSAQVLRLADAKPVQLGHVMKGDGRWRILLFGDVQHDPKSTTSPLSQTCEWLCVNILRKYTPPTADTDAVFDVRAVLPQSRKDTEITTLPDLLFPQKGEFGIRDYEKVFTDEESYGFGGGDFYARRGINADQGCVIIARPDQYVSGVVPMNELGWKMVADFFAGFMRGQIS